MPLPPISELFSRFRPEQEQRRPIVMIIGFQVKTTWRDVIDDPNAGAYQRDVRFIHDFLTERGENVITLTPTFEFPSNRLGGDTAAWNTELARIRETQRIFNVPLDGVIHSPSFVSAQYPKDWFVVGDNTIVTDIKEPAVPNLRTRRTSHIREIAVSEGGKYVEGKDIVFAAFRGSQNAQRREEISHQIYSGRRVLYVPTPRELGIADSIRVSGHIDQYIGKPLESTDGSKLYVPIDPGYYDAIQANQTLASFDYLAHGKQVIFVPVSRELVAKYQALNYVGVGEITFIGPELRKDLEARGVWQDLNQERTVVLPSEIESVIGEGGLACRLVLAEVDSRNANRLRGDHKIPHVRQRPRRRQRSIFNIIPGEDQSNN